jgi:hypothetical protein
MSERIHMGSRAAAVAAVTVGVGLLVGLELIGEPDATLADLLLELLEIAPVVLTSLGILLLLRATHGQPGRRVKPIYRWSPTEAEREAELLLEACEDDRQ